MQIVNSDKEKSITKLLVLIITVLSVKNVLFFNSAILSYQQTINIVVIGIIAVCYCHQIVFNRQINRVFLFLLLLMIAFVLCLEILIFPQNNPYIIDLLPRMIIYGILPFSLFMSLKSYEYLDDYLYIGGVIIVIAGSIVGVMQFLYQDVSGEYSMSYGTSLSYGTLCVLNRALYKRKLSSILLSIIGILLIVVLGSRGPLLSVITIFVLYIVLKSDSIIKKIITIVITTFVCLIAMSHIMHIALAINTIIERWGFHSRTLLLIINGMYTDDSGRSIVYGNVIKLINEHPMIGIGIEGLKGNGYNGWSAHNLYLQLLLEFGYIVGIIAIVSLVILWLHGIFACNNKSLKLCNVIMFSQFVPRTFFGAGLYENPWFWLLLAGCICSFRTGVSYLYNEKQFRRSR